MVQYVVGVWFSLNFWVSLGIINLEALREGVVIALFLVLMTVVVMSICCGFPVSSRFRRIMHVMYGKVMSSFVFIFLSSYLFGRRMEQKARVRLRRGQSLFVRAGVGAGCLILIMVVVVY